MASFQSFRSAFNGFKREDVVHYIEYLNNKHNSQLEQLNSQLQAALSQQNSNSELTAAQARIAELEAELDALRQGGSFAEGTELEAYRRAERAERMAQERAAQIDAQVNAALAEATLKVDNASTQIADAADRMNEHLIAYQTSVAQAKETLQEAVATMYAIRPEK